MLAVFWLLLPVPGKGNTFTPTFLRYIRSASPGRGCVKEQGGGHGWAGPSLTTLCRGSGQYSPTPTPTPTPTLTLSGPFPVLERRVPRATLPVGVWGGSRRPAAKGTSLSSLCQLAHAYTQRWASRKGSGREDGFPGPGSWSPFRAGQLRAAVISRPVTQSLPAAFPVTALRQIAGDSSGLGSNSPPRTHERDGCMFPAVPVLGGRHGAPRRNLAGTPHPFPSLLQASQQFLGFVLFCFSLSCLFFFFNFC